MKAMLKNCNHYQYARFGLEDSTVWGGDLYRGAWALCTQGLPSARILKALTAQVYIQGECPGVQMLRGGR